MPHKILGLAAALCALCVGGDAIAKPSADCYDMFRQRALKVSVDAKLEASLGRDASESLATLDRIVKRWNAIVQAPAIRRCLKAYPRFVDAHYQFVTLTERVVTKLRARRDRYCRMHGKFMIARVMRGVTEAKNKGEMLLAKRRLAQITTDLRRRAIFRNCPVMRAAIRKLGRSFVPRMHASLSMRKLVGKLSTGYGRIVRMLGTAKTELGVTNDPAMTFRDAPARAAFRRELETCNKRVKLSRALGGTDTTKVGAGQTLGGVDTLCSGMTDSGADALFAKVDAHNKAVAERQRKRWEKRLWGWGMWRIYKKYGRPEVDRRGASGAMWRFRFKGGCLTVRFDGKGKFVNKAKHVCPAQTVSKK